MPTICVSVKRDFLKAGSFRGLGLRISASKNGLLYWIPVKTCSSRSAVHQDVNLMSVF
jgi:hypothetical protein